jgi:hypothetical protein
MLNIMLLLPLSCVFAVDCHHLLQVVLLHILSQEVAKPEDLGLVFTDGSLDITIGLQGPPHRSSLRYFSLFS